MKKNNVQIEQNTRDWSPEEIRELADAAKASGIKKEDFASDWLGIHPTTLSDWMSGKQAPKSYHKKLLSHIEPKIIQRRLK